MREIKREKKGTNSETNERAINYLSDGPNNYGLTMMRNVHIERKPATNTPIQTILLDTKARRQNELSQTKHEI